MDYPEKSEVPQEEYARAEKIYTELSKISKKYHITIITSVGRS